MELKKGELLCPKCKGSGNQADYRVYMDCSYCKGTGKLD